MNALATWRVAPVIVQCARIQDAPPLHLLAFVSVSIAERVVSRIRECQVSQSQFCGRLIFTARHMATFAWIDITASMCRLQEATWSAGCLQDAILELAIGAPTAP
jgi:hypothetical protein